GVLGRAGALLIGREERIGERVHQRVRGDALLLAKRPDRLDDLLAHPVASVPVSSSFRSPSAPSTRWLRAISEYGIVTTPVPAATVTSASEAPTSSPVKLRWPSRGSRVRT